MDTRGKIVSLDNVPPLLETGEWTVVAGLFDPLTLAQAQRVAAIEGEAGRRILAVVIPDADTLLSAEARAALMAALRSVDAVVIANPEQIRGPHTRIHEDLVADRERSAEFVRFVLRRQKSAEVPA